MSSKDDKPSPHIRVVAENSKSDIDRERAKRDIERPLLRLAANIMRVSRGAGDPWEIPVQCADVIKSFHAYHDATGDWPHGEDIKEILSFRDPDLHQYRYRELEDAIETVVSGSLRMAAGQLLGQKLQADHGQKELLQGVDWIERYREERRAQWAAQQRSRSAKPKTKKAKTKGDGLL